MNAGNWSFNPLANYSDQSYEHIRRWNVPPYEDQRRARRLRLLRCSIIKKVAHHKHDFFCHASERSLKARNTSQVEAFEHVPLFRQNDVLARTAKLNESQMKYNIGVIFGF